MTLETTDPDDRQGTTTDGQPPATNWEATRASTALALLATLCTVGLLAVTLGVTVVKGLAASVAGALCFAGVCWLLTWDRWQVPATVAASALVVPAGAAAAVGVGYVLLVEFASSFPASTSTRVVGQTLRILSVAMVTLGTTAAVFGAAAVPRNFVTRESLEDGFQLVSRTAILPIGFAVLTLGYALVTNFGSGLGGPVGDLLDSFVSGMTDWFLATDSASQPRFLSFWLVATVSVWALSRALVALPTRELTAGRSIADVEAEVVWQRLEETCSNLAAAGFVGLPLVFLLDIAVPEAVVRGTLPGVLYDVLVAITGAAPLRYVLLTTALLAGVSVVATKLLRSSVQTDVRTVMVGYAPFLGGLGIVAAVLTVHGPVLDALVDFVAGRLSSPISGNFRRLAANVETFYGSHAIVLGITAGVLVVAATAVLALWLVFRLGFVRDRVSGPSIASGGLFVAVAFAGTLRIPLAVFLVGLLASLFVWDAGEFGVTLGKEIGRRADTRQVELLHAGGVLSVGVLAALSTGVLATLLGDFAGSGGSPTQLSVALPGAVVAIVLLVMALR
ncbi:DUF7519 family protein [Halorussus halophilus]|uniref:DUF7519 family protein n=1 Tax=Halorussus halophilus TaxID=2650975 RepID=UPI00178815DE|nr:hypothetical protein [Halorussus halophilus]